MGANGRIAQEEERHQHVNKVPLLYFQHMRTVKVAGSSPAFTTLVSSHARKLAALFFFHCTLICREFLKKLRKIGAFFVGDFKYFSFYT